MEMRGRQMAALGKAYNYVLFGLAGLSGVLIFLSFVMIVVDVTMRILGFTPPSFTIAVVEYGLLWFAVLAAPWLVRIKGHVFIDALAQFLPNIVRQIAAKLVYILCIIAALIYSYNAGNLLITAIVEQKVDVRTIEMPQWFLFLPMPLCFFLVATEFFRYLIGIDDMYSQSILEREGV